MTDLTSKWSARLGAFEELTSKWKQIGLTSLQKTTLDADALLITANKECLAQGRRTLGLKTKEFAQLPSDRKLSEFGSLLKSYQSYVDELTKYLTEAERCYFCLHGTVQNMVDPYPLMDRFCKEKKTLLEFVRGFEESESLRRAVKEREAELHELQNQEVTIKRLRAQLAEVELSAMANAERTVSNSQEELNGILAQWKTREAELHQELQRSFIDQRRSESEVKELSNQLSVFRSRVAELEELRDSETSALASELEEAAIQTRLLKRELDRLRAVGDARSEVGSSLGFQDVDKGTVSSQTPEANSSEIISVLRNEINEVKEESNNLRVRCSLLEKEIQKNAALKGTCITSSVSQIQIALEAAREEVNRLSEDTVEKERLIGILRGKLETAESDTIAREAEIAVLKGKIKRLEDERPSLLSAVRDLERELNGRKISEQGTPQQQKPFDLSTLIKNEINSHDSKSTIKTFSEKDVSSDEAFFAVTTQRDRLRQRLLALEEAASLEIDQLKSELKSLRDERDELLLHQQNADLSLEGTSSVRIRMPTSQLYSPHLKKSRQVSTALDMLMLLLYKHVLADVWMRRVFLAYLTMLHLFVFVDLFYQTSGLF